MPVLPEGLILAGLYGQTETALEQLPPRENWLYENFFSPHDLLAGLHHARRSRPSASGAQPPVLFLGTPDGALLAYRCEDSELEKLLLPEGADWQARAGHYRDQLLNGALPPSQFVRLLASAGQLRVMRTSRLWNRMGEVDPLKWAPFAGAVLPELGPAFLSADDAARDAQAIIHGGSDKEFGGLIFQREDATFVATRPTTGDTARFKSDSLYPMTETGLVKFPEGHRLDAVYRSNISLSAIRAQNGGDLDEEARLKIKSITPDEVRAAILDQARGVSAFYVLMSDSNIIKYVPNGSDEENALLPDLIAGKGSDELDGLSAGDFLKRLARTGGLHVVQGDAYWGPPGPVPSDWQPYPSAPAPIHPTPAFGALLDSADAAARSINEQINGRYRERRFGFILTDTHNRYLACEPTVATAPLFAPESVFGKTADGALGLPAGYRLAGLCYSAELYPQRLPCKDVWLYRNFFIPDELLAALEQLESTHPAPGTSPLPLYLSTRDGAQLKYRSRDIRADMLLFSGSANVLSYGERLVKGILDPVDFVHALADTGELSVLEPSELWGPQGRVTSDWRAYRQLPRRVLSPVFASADDAARHAHARIARRYDKVYGGVILKRPDGLFVATEPRVSPTEIFDHSLIFPNRNGFPLEDHTIFGVYNSRPGRLDFSLPESEGRLYLNLFPTWDIYRAIKDRSIPARYLSGQDGSLLRYTSQQGEHEAELLNRLSPSSQNPLDLMDNPMERRFKSGQAQDKGAVLAFARELANTGELRVLVAGHDIWTTPGKVRSIRDTAEGVSVDTEQTLAGNAEATRIPAFSPVFINSLDAVRHALEQVSRGAGRSFGFIFKKTGKEQVTTLPVIDTGNAFNRYLVLPRQIGVASLLPGYAIDGLYVHAAAASRTQNLRTDEVYRNFISPRDFAHAIATARETCHFSGPEQPNSTDLYLSTADGALLNYKVPLTLDADEDSRGGVFYNDGIETEGQLENGSLSARDYVRRVAASGKLSVRQPSPVWRNKGPVTAIWEPYQAVSIEIEGPYRVSPVFAHADDAARYTHRKIGQDQGQLLVDAIYRTSAPDGYITLEPFIDGRATKVTRTLALGDRKTQELDKQRLELTLGKTALDSIHYANPRDITRYPSNNVPYIDFYSTEDICFVTQTLLADSIFLNGIYYSTQEGALLKYEPSGSSAQGSLCTSNETGRGKARAIAPGPIQWTRAVASAGKLSVLETSSLWHTPGLIGPAWTPSGVFDGRRPRASRDLLPPLINSFNIGGVGATDVIDPQRPLPVVITPLDLKPRDRLDLYWGSHPDPVASHIQGSEPGASHLTLPVATRWIMSGEVTVRYILTPFPGGTPETAEANIRVKLEVPGEPDIHSETPDENGKLELPVVLPPGVIEDPEGVSVVVKRYANMAAGDRIKVSWHGRFVEHPALMGPSEELVIPIDPQIIREAGNADSIIVRYEIRDEVNNWSRWSRPALVEVGIGDPSLPAPVVPRAQGMQLDLDALGGADVQTLILRYDGMSSAQTLRLLVERETAQGAPLPTYNATLPGHDSDPFVSFEVPNEQFLLIIQGQARFYYYVEAPEQPSRRSKSRSLKVIGQALTLKPPRVPVAEANGNVLDPTATGVIARVEVYSFIAPGQTVSLIWIGTTAAGMEVRHEQTLPVTATDQDIDFTIPDNKVSVLAGGSVVVRYEVKTDAPEPVVSQPLLLPVSARPLDLPPPEVLEAHGSVLFPLEALTGATVRVQYKNMLASDTVQAYWARHARQRHPGHRSQARERRRQRRLCHPRHGRQRQYRQTRGSRLHRYPPGHSRALANPAAGRTAHRPRAFARALRSRSTGQPPAGPQHLCR